MKSSKCTSCGANIEIDTTKKNFTCPYCGTHFINDDKDSKNEEKNDAEVMSSKVREQFDYSDVEYPEYVHGTRPTVNIIFAVILACFYFFPAIIYVLAVLARQHVWDEYHKRK